MRTGAEGLVGPERILGGHHGRDALGAGDGDAELDQLGVGPQPAVRRVHEDRAPSNRSGACEDRRLHDHAAHRVAERHAALPAEGVEQPEQVGGEGLEGVGRLVVRLGAGAVAPLVGGHRVPAQLGQRVEVVGEVLLGAGEAVHEEQRAPAGAGLGHGERDRDRRSRRPRRCARSRPAPEAAQAAHDLAERA